MVMVFSATLNNISVVISWQSVLLVEETGVSGENHRPVASHWQTLSHNFVSSTLSMSGICTHNVTDYVGICEFNYQLITTTTTPHNGDWNNLYMRSVYFCISLYISIQLWIWISNVAIKSYNIYFSSRKQYVFHLYHQIKNVFPSVCLFVCLFLSTSFHI